jgi:dihydrofolate reductase
MGSVIYDKSSSLDGFIAGANVRLEAGLGDDGQRLHDWAFEDEAGKEILKREVAQLGAVICGRRTYDMSIQY